MILRNQLKSNRNEYQAIRYRGDLVRELMPLRLRPRVMILLGGFATSSIAAAALVGAMLLHPAFSPSSNHLSAPIAMVKESGLSDTVRSELSSLQSAARSLIPTDEFHLPLWDKLTSKNG